MSLIRLCVLAAFAGCLAVGLVRADEPKAPKPLPKEITDAWKKAGAEVGWFGPTTSGGHKFWVRDEGRVEELPAFWFPTWKAGAARMLPAPREPFALSVSAMEATGAGLTALSKFPNLQSLDIFVGKLKDPEQLELGNFKELRTLVIGCDYGLTDRALNGLGKLKDLRTLSLGSEEVTEAGLKELAGLQELRRLNLNGTKVTDAGVKHLAGLSRLQVLSLAHSEVTDGCLKDLRKLTELRELYLDTTAVSKAGVAELQKALPKCSIYGP
jgi:Leucine-rich repeat (LRR) protein